MDEDKKDEDEGLGLGRLGLVFGVIFLVITGLVVHNIITGPYRTADQLRERLDDKVNVSDDYRQGWLDCVKYWLHLTIGPHNMTSTLVKE